MANLKKRKLENLTLNIEDTFDEGKLDNDINNIYSHIQFINKKIDILYGELCKEKQYRQQIVTSIEKFNEKFNKKFKKIEKTVNRKQNENDKESLENDVFMLKNEFGSLLEEIRTNNRTNEDTDIYNYIN